MKKKIEIIKKKRKNTINQRVVILYNKATLENKVFSSLVSLFDFKPELEVFKNSITHCLSRKKTIYENEQYIIERIKINAETL